MFDAVHVVPEDFGAALGGTEEEVAGRGGFAEGLAGEKVEAEHVIRAGKLWVRCKLRTKAFQIPFFGARMAAFEIFLRLAQFPT